jgi:hypothetical protein
MINWKGALHDFILESFGHPCKSQETKTFIINVFEEFRGHQTLPFLGGIS